MSRTFKDKPWKYTTEKLEKDASGEMLVGITNDRRYYWHRELPGVKTKKKRNYTEFYLGYYSRCPSWWVKEFMTVPKRAACRNWEKTRNLSNLDDDCPDYGNKPFEYYW